MAITGSIWDSATYRVGSCPVPCQISPQLASPCVNWSQPKQSRAGGSPWMSKRNKRPQTLHAFTSTVESNVRKCLVFSSYWLVLNTQILWHLWSNPSVAWIQANFRCTTPLLVLIQDISYLTNQGTSDRTSSLPMEIYLFTQIFYWLVRCFLSYW